MPKRSSCTSARIARVVCAVALASMLGACDKCGWMIPGFQTELTQVCKSDAPSPR
jgi:hypothetical protein